MSLITARNALGSGQGAESYNILGPDLGQIAEYSKRTLLAAQKLRAWRMQITLNVSNPRFTSRSTGSARDLGVRMATIGNTLRLAWPAMTRSRFTRKGLNNTGEDALLEDQRRDRRSSAA